MRTVVSSIKKNRKTKKDEDGLGDFYENPQILNGVELAKMFKNNSMYSIRFSKNQK